MIAVKCPHCQAAIRCDDRHAGHVVACPSCKKQVRLPAIAQPLPARAGPLASPPALPTESTEQQDFSWMPGESQGASSPRPPSRTHVSRKKKTDPTLYILAGGGLILIAAGGVAFLATRGGDKPTSTSSSVAQANTPKDNAPAKTNKTASKSTSTPSPNEDLEAARAHIAETERQLLAQKQKNAAMARLTSSFDARIAALNRKEAEEEAPVREELQKLYAAAISGGPDERAKLRPRIQQLEEQYKKLSAELDSGWSQLEKDMNEAQAQGVFPNQGHPQQQAAKEPPAPVDNGSAERDRLLAGIAQQKAEIEKDFLDECSSEWDRLKRRQEALRADPSFGDMFGASGRQNYSALAAVNAQAAELKKGASGKSAPADKRRHRLAPLEQERRRILTRYPAPGDPKFIEQQGELVTEEEIAEQKALVQRQEAEKKKLGEEHGSPRAPCDVLVQSLEKKGTVEKPTYVGTFSERESKDRLFVVYTGKMYAGKKLGRKQTAFHFAVIKQNGYWYVERHTLDEHGRPMSGNGQLYTIGPAPRGSRRIPDKPATPGVSSTE